MLRSQQGSVYRVVLGCFIILAFCFALIWPQYSKRHDTKQLLQAAELGRKLAFAEETYKQTAGQYTPQFGRLKTSILFTPNTNSYRCGWKLTSRPERWPVTTSRKIGPGKICARICNNLPG